jgi:hypothetical protein
MAKGIKTGGRVKGSLNKLTLDYKAMLNAVTCNPFQIMSNLALDSEIPPPEMMILIFLSGKRQK